MLYVFQDKIILFIYLLLLLCIFEYNVSGKVCQLRSYSFNSNYSEFLHPLERKKCIKTILNDFFKYKQGVLSYKRETIYGDCRYRCNNMVTETKLEVGPWIDVNNLKPSCDVFEIMCFDKSSKKITYQDVVLQFSKKKKFKNEKPTFLKESYPINELNSKYSVHVIVLDSLSQYNIERGFSRTLNYLKETYKAINFRYLNKVASNSQPNAHSFLMNRRTFPLLNIDTGKVIPSDYEKKAISFCEDYLDDEPYIVKYYRQLNYKILIGEDGKSSVFSWQNCKGFNTSYAHHTTRPYLLNLKNKKTQKSKIYIENFHKKCLKRHSLHLDYLSSFLREYKNSKKFSLTWLTSIAHGQITGHYRYDQYFKNFFQKNKKYFDDSFVVLMADHGFKMGNFRLTEMGEYEDKNPFLVMSVPSDLRDDKNEIMENLKYNADKHISHYDVYATLFDILTEAGRKKFKELKAFNFNEFLKNDKIKGLSLLRKITQFRDCFAMEISSEYCMCTKKFDYFNLMSVKKIYNVDEDVGRKIWNNITTKIKYNFVSSLNLMIIKGGIDNKCVKLSLKNNGIFMIKYRILEDNKLLFWVRQEVSPKGVYEAYFLENGNIAMLFHFRIDSYKKYTSPCVKPDIYEKYCYCKNFLKKRKKIFKKKTLSN